MQRASARVEEIGGAVELVRRVQDVGQDPPRRRACRVGQSRRKLQHPRAEVDADDLVRAEVPERERVATGGALEMDRPPASPVQVADQLDLCPEQVRATAPDLGDGVRQPAFVAFGRLVPGGLVGAMHETGIGPLAGRRRPDQPAVVVSHARSLPR